MMRHHIVPVVVLVLGLSAPSPSSAKTIDHNSSQSAQVETWVGGLLATMVQSVLSHTNNTHTSDSMNTLSSLILSKVGLNEAKLQELKGSFTQSLGVSDEVYKPLSRILEKISNLYTEQANTIGYSSNFNDNSLNSNTNRGEETLSMDGRDANLKFLQFIKTIFEEEFQNLNTFIPAHSHDSSSSSSNTSSNIWVLIKSTWQRLLAYIEEDNSLETFMQHTPVKVIDRIMNLGDDISLMNFLAEKLEPDLANYITTKTSPYLGPFQNFNKFYNFTMDYGMNGIVDYFTSEKFRATMNLLSRLVSAYMEDRVSSDLVNQYIELISFDNPELHNFYKSIMKTKHTNSSTEEDTHIIQRYRRDIFEHIASTFNFDDTQSGEEGEDEFQSRTHTVIDQQAVESKYSPLTELQKAGRQIIQRDGGYGGGGYGGGGGGGGYGGGHQYGYMSTLDPYAALGALALGTLLGFVLFRLINGTRRGRRDIGDGSLSLWDSDLPNQMLPWGSSVERMKRQVDDNTRSFSLPPSLRGDVWSSDPLVADNLLDDHLDEDDIAHHLNHLWHLYKDTNQTTCVHSHLCHAMANTTAHQLSDKDSSLPLFMASLANLMGVVRSGQLVDHVTQTLVLGQPFTCPTPFPTCAQIM